MKLRVHSVDADDFLRDVVRVHPSRRRADVKSGHLCKVQVADSGKYIIALARNWSDQGSIKLSSFQREKLGISAGAEVDFEEIAPASWFQKLNWVWRATDPVIQTTGRLGILSFWLGVIGILLGAWSVYLTW